MVYWLSLDVVEQRAEEEERKNDSERKGGEGEREIATREKQKRRTERKERKKKGKWDEEGGKRTDREGTKERRVDYRPRRRRLVYGSADAHHLLKKTCCSKCVHFACPGQNEIADRIALRFLRSGQVERACNHSFLIF